LRPAVALAADQAALVVVARADARLLRQIMLSSLPWLMRWLWSCG